MRNEYDFSAGRHAALDPLPPGKTRITIRLDDEVIDWFRGRVEDAGRGTYQTQITAALREYIQQQKEPLEETLRRVLREELREELRRTA